MTRLAKQVKNRKTQIVKQLRENDVYYLYAQKGNKVIILGESGCNKKIKTNLNARYIK